MKPSELEKRKDLILNEMLQKNNRADEVLVQLSPTQRAKLNYFLDICGWKSLEEYIHTQVDDLFTRAIHKSITAEEGIAELKIPDEIKKFLRGLME